MSDGREGAEPVWVDADEPPPEPSDRDHGTDHREAPGDPDDRREPTAGRWPWCREASRGTISLCPGGRRELMPAVLADACRHQDLHAAGGTGLGRLRHGSVGRDGLEIRQEPPCELLA